jgi:hypothetical protein
MVHLHRENGLKSAGIEEASGHPTTPCEEIDQAVRHRSDSIAAH